MPRDPVLKPSTLKSMRRWVRDAQKYGDIDDQARQGLAVIESSMTWVLRQGRDPLVTVLRAAEARRQARERAAAVVEEAARGE